MGAFIAGNVTVTAMDVPFAFAAPVTFSGWSQPLSAESIDLDCLDQCAAQVMAEWLGWR